MVLINFDSVGSLRLRFPVFPSLTSSLFVQVGSDSIEDAGEGQQAVSPQMAELSQRGSQAGGLVDRGGVTRVALNLPACAGPGVRIIAGPRASVSVRLRSSVVDLSSVVSQDELLLEGHRKVGNRWTEIAKMVQGRTDNAVKNRFAVLVKKQARIESYFLKAISTSRLGPGLPSPVPQAKPDKNRGKKRAKPERDGDFVQTPTQQAADRSTQG